MYRFLRTLGGVILVPIIFVIFSGCVTGIKSQSLSRSCSMIKDDLTYIHKVIQNDFSGYKYSSAIKQAANDAYNAIMSELETCDSPAYYPKAIKRYFAVFRDPHIQPVWSYVPKYEAIFNLSTGKIFKDSKFDFIHYASTGVLLQKINNRFIVTNIDKSLLSDKSSVQVGDELLSYDKNSPLAALREEILPFEAVSVLKAGEYRHASKLFFRWDKSDGDRTLAKFRRGNEDYELNLKWHPVDKNYLSIFDESDEKPIYEVLNKKYGKWIFIRSFAGYNKKNNAQLAKLVSDALTLHNEKIIVVDIRGNGGGVSSWGTKWIENLYGYEPNIPPSKPSLILASKSNYLHYKRLYDGFSKQGGISSPEIADAWQHLLSCLKVQTGELIECEKNEGHTKKPNDKKKSKFSGRVLLLTDWKNFSSAEIFIQELKSMPNVIHVGVETDASTNFGDIRFDVTPNGLPFKVPTKVFFGLFQKRKPSEPFSPEIELKYDFDAELKGQDSLMMQLDKLILSKSI